MPDLEDFLHCLSINAYHDIFYITINLYMLN